MDIKRYREDIIIILVTILLGGMIIFFSDKIFQRGFISDKMNQGVQYYKGEVVEILNEKLQADNYIDDIELGYQQLRVRIMEGPYKNQDYEVTNNISRLYSTIVKKDSKVIVAMYHVDGKLNNMSISSFKRNHILGIMVVLFLAVVLLVGGFKGLKAIISLVFTIICIIFLMLPMMLRGVNPIFAAILISFLSTAVTLTVVSGINKKGLASIIGTVLGVIIAGVLAYVFGKLTNLSGINSEYAENILYISESTGLQIRGILFAGILTSALGAVMDVAMSISSSVFEIYNINKELKVNDLFKSGMNIGRDIIGTMTNTLILAFAGGSLGTLFLIYSSNMNYNFLWNLDVLGIEIIQGLAGTTGIVLTVPITAIISAYLCKSKRIVGLKVNSK